MYRLAASYGLSPEFKQHAEQFVLSRTGRSVIGFALTTRRSVHIPESRLTRYTHLDPARFEKFYRDFLGVRSFEIGLRSAPIMIGNRAARQYTERQIALVTIFADRRLSRSRTCGCSTKSRTRPTAGNGEPA